MKKGVIVWVVVGVVVVHAAILGVFSVWRPVQRPTWTPKPADDFGRRTITYVNEATGDRTVVKEFTVSTKLYDDADERPPEVAR